MRQLPCFVGFVCRGVESDMCVLSKLDTFSISFMFVQNTKCLYLRLFGIEVCSVGVVVGVV